VEPIIEQLMKIIAKEDGPSQGDHPWILARPDETIAKKVLPRAITGHRSLSMYQKLALRATSAIIRINTDADAIWPGRRKINDRPPGKESNILPKEFDTGIHRKQLFGPQQFYCTRLQNNWTREPIRKKQDIVRLNIRYKIGPLTCQGSQEHIQYGIRP